MNKIQSFLLPAALLGCLVVAWFSTMAARGLPSTWLAENPANQQQAGQNNAAGEPESNQKANPPALPADNACPLSQRFPASILQWCGLIQKYASDNELSAQLVAAVMLQESGGDPLAYSSSGAVGLMQVMPKDGIAASFQCTNGPCFSKRPSIAELQDPEFNLSFGTRMLAGLVRKLGSIRDGLAGYGPANVGYYYADKVLTIYENYR